MYKSILVPLDKSHFAEHALPLAASVARHSGAVIRLLHVLPPLSDRYFMAPMPGSDVDKQLHDEFRKESLAYLESAAARLPGLSVHCDLLDEHIDIPEAIATEVAKTGVDLIVMASHGRGALQRLWLGSIADEVYRASTAPVLLARPKDERASAEGEWQIREIVAPLDGSDGAEEALEPVMNLGQAMQAQIQLVRVIPEAQASATAYLEGVAARLSARGAHVRTQLLVSSDPAEAIAAAAAQADLIAMRTHARGGVARLIRGSVVDKIVQASTVPILITRPRQ
jgi:nucleotide-binding universal stress UspA family protein